MKGIILQLALCSVALALDLKDLEPGPERVNRWMAPNAPKNLACTDFYRCGLVANYCSSYACGGFQAAHGENANVLQLVCCSPHFNLLEISITTNRLLQFCANIVNAGC